MTIRVPTAAELRWVVADALVLTRRNLIKYRRVPTLLAFSTIQPVMLVLLFTYVFGGAIGATIPASITSTSSYRGSSSRVAVFGSTVTGVALADDMSKASSIASGPCPCRGRPCWRDAPWGTWFATCSW